MSWWDALQGILKGRFSKNKLLSGIKIASDIATTKNTTYVDKQIVFNFPRLGKKEIQTLQEAIRGSLSKGDELIQEGPSETIEGLIAQGESPSREIISFFRTRVSIDTLGLISSAYYIKSFHDKGDRQMVNILKTQLGQRYGKRGHHLTNLCTEGYLEADIVPYLRKVEKEGLLENLDFEEVFLGLVDNFPTAVFISSRMKPEEVEEEIKKQMNQNKQNGIEFLTIHGINKENVTMIEKVIDRLESEGSILGKQTIKKADVVKITINI